MTDFLGNTLNVGDTVVWRGPLSGNCGLKKAVVLSLAPKSVWIEVPHWYIKDKFRKTCVLSKNVIKV